jgi:lipid II:glycine glycyltransferase (peptidoglycan interpeptide bridge formation enzyme)
MSVPDCDWDTQLLSLGGHFLQSRAWARCQERMGSTVFHTRGDGWMWLAVTRRVGPFQRLYLPYGPTVADDRSLAVALDAAAGTARELRCGFVQFEPNAQSVIHPGAVGAVRTRMRQPADTWLLRIDVDESSLRSGLTKGHRGSINAAERRGLTLERAASPEEVGGFLEVLHRTHQRTGMPIHADAYYRAIVDELMPSGEASLYIARSEECAVAAAIVFDLGDTRYYAYAGSDPSARQLSPAAPLVWRMILDARADGKRWFDFWGIAPPGRPDHIWSGFTQFKRAFGGEALQRAGTWDLPVRPLSYRVWALANSLRRR